VQEKTLERSERKVWGEGSMPFQEDQTARKVSRTNLDTLIIVVFFTRQNFKVAILGSTDKTVYRVNPFAPKASELPLSVAPVSDTGML